MKIFFNPLSGNIDMAPDNTSKNIFFSDWFNDGSDPAPLMQGEFNQKVFFFAQGAEQVIKGQIKVMADYFAGALLMRFSFYAQANIGKSQWSLSSILHQIGADASNLSNINLKVSDVVDMNSGVNYKIYKLEMALTDDTGKINGVQVKADDTIDFMFKRLTLPSDDLADDIRVRPTVEIIKA